MWAGSARVRSTQVAALLTALALGSGCRSVYYAELPRSARAAEHIDHCLGSLALEDRSGEPRNATSISRDPDLVAIWASKHQGSLWHLSATAWVRQKGNRWHLTFRPGPPGSSNSIELFAHAFARCIALHDPGLRVDVDASMRPAFF